jgi:hypothetical protein
MAKRAKDGEAEGMVRYSTFLRRDQIEAMHAVYERDGVKPAEQIRRALDAGLGLRAVSRKGRRA